MTETNNPAKIPFRPVAIADKPCYDRLMTDGNERGYEFSFANVFIWGEQNVAFLHGQIVLYSRFDDVEVYPYPVGDGDKKAVLDAVIADSAARGILCRITGLSETEKQRMEALYPKRFAYTPEVDYFDYVYAIDDLAELKGKKYHGKRNHVNRFRIENPDYTVHPLTGENLPAVRAMTDAWFAERLASEADEELEMEKIALDRAYDHYEELAMDGLILMRGGEVLAMTMGSRLSADTLDVHFEKARSDVSGAYAAINWEFARYIRTKYPDIRFFDREEDMGLEGLRRAKQSYHPHHMVVKYYADLRVDGDED